MRAHLSPACPESRIRRSRLARGLTLTEVGRLMDVPVTVLTRLERETAGTSCLRLRSLRGRVAEVLLRLGPVPATVPGHRVNPCDLPRREADRGIAQLLPRRSP